MGGTSLSVLKLAIALDRALSVKNLIGHPILADQAELLDRRAAVPVASCPSVATSEVVEAVKFNDPAQTVIAGRKAAVEKA